MTVDTPKTTAAALSDGYWRHIKRGTTYQVIACAELQAVGPVKQGDTIVIYVSPDGKLWARSRAEFLDGRFERVP